MSNFALIKGAYYALTVSRKQLIFSLYLIMKGIKMLLGALAAASLLFSVNASAQENNNRDENGNVVRGAYETNKALDNISITLGVGYNAGINFGNKGKIPFAQGMGGLGVDLGIAKMWTPFIGLRLNYHGWANNVNGKFAVNAPRQHFFTGDLLWSLTDTFWGYKQTRAWDVLPYASAGLLRYNAGTPNHEWVLGGGILNKFYISDRIDFIVDLRAMISKNNGVYNAPATGKLGIFEIPVSATLGLAINLGKTNFDRHSSITPVVIPVPFTTEQYNALADKVSALEKENAALKNKIAALQNEIDTYKNMLNNGQTYVYENGNFTAVDAKAGAPITVYFDCGSSTLSAREKAHLEYFCESVVDANTKLAVNGYADKQTGSAKRNQQLSEQRVKTVVDLLKKAGASEANIESAAHGATVQPFKSAALNRVVTVEVK